MSADQEKAFSLEPLYMAPPPTSSPSSPAPAAVTASLSAFVRGLIDYAGLFPPAKLSLEEAVTNFAAYRHTDDAWMLGRFIVPASRLPELEPFTDLFEPHAAFPVSVIGSGGDDATSFLKALSADLERVERAEAAHAGRLRAGMLEVRLPPSVVEEGGRSLEEVIARFTAVVDAAAVHFERVCLEVGFTSGWRRHLQEVVDVVAAAPAHAPALGLKLRCGGLTPNAFPTPEQVAFFLSCTRQAKLPFKATAGLHHPIRHYSRKLEAMEHGFLNVFGAGVLVHALDLSEAAIRQVLRSEQPRAFAFDADGFSFEDLRISTAQIEAARAHFALSYGSCSFDEPRAELRALGLL